MKLSDFCVLFVCLFVCLFLGRDLKIASLAQSQVSQIQYNRLMDRVNEDALMDVLMTEYEDGALQWDALQLQDRFHRLLQLQFDLTDDDAWLRARLAVTLYEVRQFPYNLSADELDCMTAMMEQCLRERDRLAKGQQARALFLPYIPADSFSQSLHGVQFLTVFDPNERGLWYDRVQFSGSRIVKLIRKTDDSGSRQWAALVQRTNKT